MKLVIAAIVFLASVHTYGRGCMMTFDLSAIKQGIKTNCGEMTPSPADFCKPKKIRKGITYKIVSSCPDNYVAKCAQSQAAVNAAIEQIKKLPGAKVTKKGNAPKNAVYTTYYYNAADARDGKVACSRGQGKWTEK